MPKPLPAVEEENGAWQGQPNHCQPPALWLWETHTFLNTVSSYLCWICYSTAHGTGCRLLPAKHHDTDVVNQSLQHLWEMLLHTVKVLLLEEVFPWKILSLLEPDNPAPAPGLSQEICPQEEFWSHKRELCRGLLCTVIRHESL